MKVCFLHLPKCGGTSVIAALMQTTPRHRGLDAHAARMAAAFLERPMEKFTHDVLAYYLSRRDLDLLYGHYEVSPRLLDAHPEWNFVTLLRDPVTRFLSNYFFNRAHPSWRDMFPEGQTLEQFLDGEEALKFGHNYVSSLGFDQPRSDRAILAAKRMFSDKFAVVGCLEDLVDFAGRLHQQLSLDLHIGHKNGSPPRPQVSSDVLDKIQTRCAPNIEIYEYVRDQLVVRSR